MTIAGMIVPSVATIPPATPARLKPTYVAMLMPIGPGVDSDIAIMSVMKRSLNQPVRWLSSWRNGIVAIPPPTAKSPILKNSIKS